MTPARLAPRDWVWSLLLHGGVVLVAVSWADSTLRAPDFRPLPVTLARQASVVPPPSPPPAMVNVPAPTPTPRPVVRPTSATVKAQPTRAPSPTPPAPVVTSPVLQSAPAVVVPVAAVESAAQASTAPAQPAAPMVATPAVATSALASVSPAVRPPVVATPAAVHREEEVYRRWRDHLMHALHQHKRYPPSARRMGQTGTVHMRVRVSAAGELLSAELVESSGFKALDGAAELLVRTVLVSLASQLQPGRATELRIPVVYELKES